MKSIDTSNLKLLSEKLLNETYYTKKFSMFLRESYGILDQIKDIYVEWLKTTNDVSLELLNRFNIFDDKYYDFLKDYDDNKIQFTFLDKIAEIYNISRKITINKNGSKKVLNLNNQDLLTIIKMSITKQFYDGTIENLVKIYEDVGVPITIITDPKHPARATVYLRTTNDDGKTESRVTENIKEIFLYSDIFIESMGVTYTKTLLDDLNFAISDFYEPDSENPDRIISGYVNYIEVNHELYELQSELFDENVVRFYHMEEELKVTDYLYYLKDRFYLVRNNGNIELTEFKVYSNESTEIIDGVELNRRLDEMGHLIMYHDSLPKVLRKMKFNSTYYYYSLKPDQIFDQSSVLGHIINFLNNGVDDYLEVLFMCRTQTFYENYNSVFDFESEFDQLVNRRLLIFKREIMTSTSVDETKLVEIIPCLLSTDTLNNSIETPIYAPYSDHIYNWYIDDNNYLDYRNFLYGRIDKEDGTKEYLKLFSFIG